MTNQDELKKMAADKACEFVESGMFVGLGTGSTAKFVVENLGQKFKSGELVIKGAPTSLATKELAESFGIEMVDVKDIDFGELDLVIDGADQIDLESGVCVKGGGGAHYWEKMIAERAKKMIVVVDESKVVSSFEGVKIPLEVDEAKQEEVIEALSDYELSFRGVKSDFGNLIADVVFNSEMDIWQFDEFLSGIEGVIETGIFASMVDIIVVSGADGTVEVVEVDYS